MRQFCVVTLALLIFVPSLCAQDVGNQSASVTPHSETIVYPVRSGSADDLGDALARLYENHQISSQSEHNVLLIRVDADTKEEILRVLAELDRPKRTIIVHAYLLSSHGTPLSADETADLTGTRDEVLKRITALQKDDHLSIENRIELSTIENQRAMVQTGKRLPVVAGSTVSSSRGRINNYQTVSTGTIFSVTAKTTPDDEIVMEINFEKSDVDRQAEPSEDDVSPPATISTLTHQTTVQLSDGEAVLAGTMVRKSNAGSGHSYLVVTANVRSGSAQQSSRPRGALSGGSGALSGGNRTATPRSPRPPRTESTSGGRFGRSGLTSERFNRMARDVFDRADGDNDGVLSGDELDGRSVGAFRADFINAKVITFDEYKKVMAKRLGVTLGLQNKVEPKPTQSATTPQSETKKSVVISRYLEFAKRLIDKYDGDGDGMLNAKESSMMSTSNNPSPADVNEDGFITAEELAAWYMKR